MARGAYLHFPFCKRKCLYCDFAVTAVGTSPQQTQFEKYHKAIKREIQGTTIRGIPVTNQSLQTLYFGGGTPSLMPTDLLLDLRNQFSLSSNHEATIELDPGTFDVTKLQKLSDQQAFNRFSMGIQTLNEKEFSSLGRGHNYSQIMESVELLKSQIDLSEVSTDLMIGLPHQTLESFMDTMIKTEQLGFGHISLYILQLEENTPFHKRYKEGLSPLPQNVEDLYRAMQEYLCKEKGFVQYEISNFARSVDFMSQHNKLYWEGDAEFAAFGNNASSFVNGRRFSRPHSLSKYFRWVEDKRFLDETNGILDSDLVLAETIMMTRLRSSDGFLFDQIRPYIGNDVMDDFEREIENSYLLDQGLIHKTDGGIRLDQYKGFILSNSIIAEIISLLD